MSADFGVWLQQRLTAHGFPVGPIDGNIGDTTIAAMRAFEKAHNLPQDGTADDPVVKALRAPVVATPLQTAIIPDRNTDPEPDEPVRADKTRPLWPRQANMSAFYGEVGTSQTAIEIPFAMYLAWDRKRLVKKMTLHKKCAASALRALVDIGKQYSEKDRAGLGIDIFGGSLNVRKMRGGNRWSMHAWGAAIDFDPERNQLHWAKPEARLSHSDAVPFWRAWEKEGWVSLGRARNFDWMHVQAANL